MTQGPENVSAVPGPDAASMQPDQHSRRRLIAAGSTGLFANMTDRGDGDDAPQGPIGRLRSREMSREMSRRTVVKGMGALISAATFGKAIYNIVGMFNALAPPTNLEQQKAEFDKKSNSELAQWILDNTGDVATKDKPIRTPSSTPAYKDLEETASGRPAFEQSLLKLGGQEVKMLVEVNRDILLFRALLTAALKDPANYFEGKPILVQSGQLTNRSGSHKSVADKSHAYGSSIDFSGAMIDGSKSDEASDNIYPFNSPINRQLGKIMDEVGKQLGVTTSSSVSSLERVDSLHGVPGLSQTHYHFNASADSATRHAEPARNMIKNLPGMHFEVNDPTINLGLAHASSEGVDFIHEYEGFSDTTYGDAGGNRGTLTIGYGATYYLSGTVITRNGKETTIAKDDEKPLLGDVITEEEADKLTKATIERNYLKPVVKALEKFGMAVTQPQLDAFVSYSYHRGPGNATKLVERLKKPADAGHGNDGLAVRAAFMYDINTEVKAVFREGVSDRYLDTAELFTSGDYKRDGRTFDPTAWSIIIDAYFG